MHLSRLVGHGAGLREDGRARHAEVPPERRQEDIRAGRKIRGDAARLETHQDRSRPVGIPIRRQCGIVVGSTSGVGA